MLIIFTIFSLHLSTDLIPFFPQTRATLNNFQSMLGKKIFDISYKSLQLKKKKKNTLKDAVWFSKVKLTISDPVEFDGYF